MNEFEKTMVDQKVERVKSNYQAYRITLWEAAREIGQMVENGYLESGDADTAIKKVARMRKGR